MVYHALHPSIECTYAHNLTPSNLKAYVRGFLFYFLGFSSVIILLDSWERRIYCAFKTKQSSKGHEESRGTI